MCELVKSKKIMEEDIKDRDQKYIDIYRNSVVLPLCKEILFRTFHITGAFLYVDQQRFQVNNISHAGHFSPQFLFLFHFFLIRSLNSLVVCQWLLCFSKQFSIKLWFSPGRHVTKGLLRQMGVDSEFRQNLRVILRWCAKWKLVVAGCIISAVTSPDTYRFSSPTNFPLQTLRVHPTNCTLYREQLIKLKVRFEN